MKLVQSLNRGLCELRGLDLRHKIVSDPKFWSETKEGLRPSGFPFPLTLCPYVTRHKTDQGTTGLWVLVRYYGINRHFDLGIFDPLFPKYR